MNKLTDNIKNQIITLYSQGKMDSEIANILNISRGTIWYWRNQVLKLPTKFTYQKISKIDNAKFEELFYKGLTDAAIAKQLDMSADGIYSHRQRYGYLRECYFVSKPINISKKSYEILLGIMMGDGYMGIMKSCINPHFVTSHGPKQKDYSKYIYENLSDINPVLEYNKRKTPDKRNNKYYESYVVRVNATPSFLPMYNSFYIDKKKHIPLNLLKDFTEQTLAYWFMDDGSKTNNGYIIATMCFLKDELVELQKFLYNKFKLNTSLFKNNTLYIKSDSKDLFTRLIKPYICDCMQYKLHNIQSA